MSIIRFHRKLVQNHNQAPQFEKKKMVEHLHTQYIFLNTKFHQIELITRLPKIGIN